MKETASGFAPPLKGACIAAPFNDVNVLVTDSAGVTRLTSMYWQLIQPWNEDFASRYTCFNTRAESLAKRQNIPLLRRRRCILPVSSFFETRKFGGAAVKPKESYEFRLKGGGLIALGGIYTCWTNPADAEDRRFSCSIITLEPNEIIGEVHDRMPFILPEDDVSTWLDPGVSDFDLLMDLIRPLDSTLMERSRDI